MSEVTALLPDNIKSENKKYHAFINLGLFLAVLTGIEIIVIFFPWNPWLIFWILVVLSVIKFACVIAWFMHLVYDKLLLTLVFMTGMILATGTVAALLLLFSFDHVDVEAIDILEVGMLTAPSLLGLG
jgi:cytochrome c oxidase subunit 4